MENLRRDPRPPRRGKDRLPGRTVEIIRASRLSSPRARSSPIGDRPRKTTIALTSSATPVLAHRRPGASASALHVMTAMRRQRASVRGTDVAYVPPRAPPPPSTRRSA